MWFIKTCVKHNQKRWKKFVFLYVTIKSQLSFQTRFPPKWTNMQEKCQDVICCFLCQTYEISISNSVLFQVYIFVELSLIQRQLVLISMHYITGELPSHLTFWYLLISVSNLRVRDNVMLYIYFDTTYVGPGCCWQTTTECSWFFVFEMQYPGNWTQNCKIDGGYYGDFLLPVILPVLENQQNLARPLNAKFIIIRFAAGCSESCDTIKHIS